MDPSWIIAIVSVLTFLSGTAVGIYKFVNKIRSERHAAQTQQHALAQEALRVAREETDSEREKYVQLLLKQVKDLEEDLSNEQQAREALQRRFEEQILGRKGKPQ